MPSISKKIHLYLSIPFGLLITVICATGAMLALQSDIIRMLNLDYYYITPDGAKPMEVDEIVKMVKDSIPATAKIAGMEISADPHTSYRVKLSDTDHSTVFVNQYTGQILGIRGETKFFATAKRLHRTLLDSRPASDKVFHGKYITGLTAISLAVIVITGLIIWLPVKHHGKWKILTRPASSGLHKFNFTLHGVAGTYASIFLLAMSLTGLTWSYQWYRIAFYNLFGAVAPVQKKSSHIDLLPDDPKLSAEIARGWTRVFHHLDAAENGYDLVALSPNHASGYYSSDKNSRARDFYTFEDNGEIKNAELYRDAPVDKKLQGWIYAIHTGSFGGIFTRIIWALAALTGALLPIGGYIIWWKRITPTHGAHRCSDGCNKALKSDSR
ncbi:MAG: PepSY domain-containing protein [Muribaculum sp.]|nr:PepSY domain-containing protein [Muribaculum sp.]